MSLGAQRDCDDVANGIGVDGVADVDGYPFPVRPPDRKQRDHRLAEYREPVSPLRLYQRFLFYKYFIAPENPVLVTEGKTDIIYLRAAIKSLHAKFPQLVAVAGGGVRLAPKADIPLALTNVRCWG